MRAKAVSVGAGVCELVGIAHPDEIWREATAEAGDLRHHIAPQVRRGRIAVQEKKRWLAFANLDIGHSLVADHGEFLGVRLEAMRHRHLLPVGGIPGAKV